MDLFNSCYTTLKKAGICKIKKGFALFIGLHLLLLGSIFWYSEQARKSSLEYKQSKVIKKETLQGHNYYFLANGDTLSDCSINLMGLDGKVIRDNCEMFVGDSLRYFGKECYLYPTVNYWKCCEISFDLSRSFVILKEIVGDETSSRTRYIWID